MKLMHDDGKAIQKVEQKTSRYLGYPQEQDNVEAYNKIVIAEFLQVEEQMDEKDAFVNPYN